MKSSGSQKEHALGLSIPDDLRRQFLGGISERTIVAPHTRLETLNVTLWSHKLSLVFQNWKIKIPDIYGNLCMTRQLMNQNSLPRF